MIINHNIAALTAYRNMTIAGKMVARSIERLSSGLRINRAADDPAGLAISERMRAQIRGLQQASRNAQDGISMTQTAEGALNETHAMLQRIRELVIQGHNGTLSDSDKRAIQQEIDQLIEEIGGIAGRTKFNTRKLLDGSCDSGTGKGLWLQLGANAGQGTYIQFGNMSAGTLGASAEPDFALNGVNILKNSYDDNMAVVDQALADVSSERGRLGAYVNRLEHTISNLDTTAENLIAAESRIRDADMAKEMMALTKYSLLQQVAQAMLVQANQQAESVLWLLQQMAPNRKS
ncbi:flagellin [Desulfotomaculum arcticum]|uniref:Flagellin n=1 Tax=Desulfotruncus arcticus DSM 17038 TaxID=1121424 RepID=A0A1I2N1X5_9FIRM|nr:flagellin [Desulfotruncus arcticus]SFF95536.1 flagellin [Desulfotomaculum arcticum] [Desulfotruncus arcticus DSM 17038]